LKERVEAKKDLTRFGKSLDSKGTPYFYPNENLIKKKNPNASFGS